MPIVIVGAGVTGLTVADRLQDRGESVVVVEKEPVVGGLCRSYRYGDFVFDIGPHRLSSNNELVNIYFRGVFNGKYNSISRYSSVYMNEKYLAWPLSIRSVLGLPFGKLVNCAVDMLSLDGAPEAGLKNLEEYIKARYGPTIFKLFWEKYTEKFLGIPCREVDADWARLSIRHAIIDRKVVPNGLLDLAKNCLFQKGAEVVFMYPEGGMGIFPDLMAQRVRARGGKILTSQNIDSIVVEPDSRIRIRAGGNEIEGSGLVWTGSLTDLCRLMGEPDPGLQYISTVLYNVELSEDSGDKWQWTYFPDSNCVFSRISLPSRFGREAVPLGKCGVCVEVTCMEGSSTWQKPEALIDRVKQDLARVGVTDSVEKIAACHVERVRDTYPLYRSGYSARFKEAIRRLAQHRNIHPVGRQAAFSYDNIDDAVHNAMIFADSLHQN